MLLITAALFSCTARMGLCARRALITLWQNNTAVAPLNPTVPPVVRIPQLGIFVGEFLEMIVTVKTPTGEGFLDP